MSYPQFIVEETTTFADLTDWYTEVDPNTAYVISGGSIMSLGFYDSSYTWIERQTSSDVFTSPANAAYMKVASNVLLNYLDTLQIEEGTVATYYK